MSEDCDIHIGFVDTKRSDWHTSGTAANHKRVADMGKLSYLIGNDGEGEVPHDFDYSTDS